MSSADAPVEAVLSDWVILRDVSAWMPLHRKKRAKVRSPKDILRAYTHHSGALGPYGYIGARASAKYVVNQRNFPQAAYTFWLSHEPDKDKDGRIIVYRLNPDERVSWHTGGEANHVGVSICWQGNLRRKEPSEAQYKAARVLYPWVAARYGLDKPECFGLHAERDEYNTKIKASCPGPFVTEWVKEWRQHVEPFCRMGEP